MQAHETEKYHKNKRDEEAINFRPSPNFKHMKKYLKSKFEEANNSGAGEQGSPTAEEEERVDKISDKSNMMVQPPLPPNPPPPDNPLQITLKREIEDDEYQNNEEPKTEDLPEYKSYHPDGKEKVMCRQFARGACNRGAACIYTHEVILSQLPGIYTFCKNFQNSGCSFPKCKFVHATVFEKECFYRTGYLPPHSLAHLKESNTVQPPPPPPTTESAPLEVPPVFSNPPPPIVHQSNVPSTSGIGGTAEALGALAAVAAAALSPLKRTWSDIDEFGGPSRDPDRCEPSGKKCKNCDLTEFRLQCNKSKVEKLMRSSQEMHKKMSLLTKKNNEVYNVVISLLKNPNVSKAGASFNFFNSNFRNDKDKAILEKLKLYFASNNRLSLNGDDSKF